MILRFGVLLVFVFQTILADGQIDSVSVERAYSQILSGQPDRAIEIYDSLNKSNPDELLYVRYRAYAYMMNEDFVKSRADYKNYCEQDPECANCYANLARMDAAEENFGSAIQLANKAVALDPDNGYSYSVRAGIYEMMGKNFDAEMDYDRVVELMADEPEPYFDRAMYQIRKGQNFKAIQDLTRTIKIDTDEFNAYYWRMRLYIQLEKWKEALQDAKVCIRLDSTNAEHYSSFGTILLYMNQADESIEWFDRSIALDSTDYMAYMNRAMAFYNMEDMDRSCYDFQQAGQRIDRIEENESSVGFIEKKIADICDPTRISYYYQRGIAQYNLGHFNKAIEWYDKGLEKFPGSPLVYYFRGNAHWAQYQYDSALESYSRSMENRQMMVHDMRKVHDTQNYMGGVKQGERMIIAEVHTGMAECLASLGNLKLAGIHADSAITILDDGFKSHPEYPGMMARNYNLIGWVYSADNRIGDAEDYFRKALLYDENNVHAMTNLANVLINMAGGSMIKVTRYQMNISGVLPSESRMLPPKPLKKRTVVPSNEGLLKEALSLCDRVLASEPRYAYGYLTRAQVKMALGLSDYCFDALVAKELGVVDVMKYLGIECQ